MNVLQTGANGFIGRYLLAALISAGHQAEGAFGGSALFRALAVLPFFVPVVAASRPLPPAYRRCVAIWFALGWPAFGAFLVIFWLMVAKPDLW